MPVHGNVVEGHGLCGRKVSNDMCVRVCGVAEMKIWKKEKMLGGGLTKVERRGKLWLNGSVVWLVGWIGRGLYVWFSMKERKEVEANKAHYVFFVCVFFCFVGENLKNSREFVVDGGIYTHKLWGAIVKTNKRESRVLWEKKKSGKRASCCGFGEERSHRVGRFTSPHPKPTHAKEKRVWKAGGGTGGNGASVCACESVVRCIMLYPVRKGGFGAHGAWEIMKK